MEPAGAQSSDPEYRLHRRIKPTHVSLAAFPWGHFALGMEERELKGEIMRGEERVDPEVI